MKKHGERTVKSDWWIVRNGESPAKTLGLDADERRVAMCFCTSKQLLQRVKDKCIGCPNCRLPEFYATVLKHINTQWVDLPQDVRDRLIDLYFSPDFTCPPGFSNFPECLKRQAQAAIRPLHAPDPLSPNYLQACLDLAAEMRRREKNGWYTYAVNRTLKRAIPAASAALMAEPTATRESDFTVDQTIEQAKQEAARTGKAVTISVIPEPEKRSIFDHWTRQMQEYKETGKVFPLLEAIRKNLLTYDCAKNVLSAVAVFTGTA